MKNKTEIVPILLANGESSNEIPLSEPQAPSETLIAHLKFSHSEIFLYQGIKMSTIRLLLSEMNHHENR